MVAEAKVCDLEWALQEETAIFPPWMNHADLEWPEGAETGTPILKEHDVAFFDKAWDKMEALKVSLAFSWPGLFFKSNS